MITYSGDRYQRMASQNPAYLRVGNPQAKDAYVVMIRTLVESAFQTGCLSVESEGLIRQVLALKGYGSDDLEALANLCDAVNAGSIQRESRGRVALFLEEPRQLSQCYLLANT